MLQEMNADPVPDFRSSEIAEMTRWLQTIVQAMRAHNDSFTKAGIGLLDEDALARNHALARESSRQLALLFASSARRFRVATSTQLVGLSRQISPTQLVREDVDSFMGFLNHFSDARWMGSLLAPEFVEQKENVVRLLLALQTTTKKGAPPGTFNCSRCKKHQLTASTVCPECSYCAHGYSRTRGCSSGCHLVVPQDVFGNVGDGDMSSSAQLMKLAKMAEALAAFCREDSDHRLQAQKESKDKIAHLDEFKEIMQEVPQVFRRFLLLRSSSIEGDLQELKAWVTQEEAHAAHKQLEEFRDEAAEEKVIRRLRTITNESHMALTNSSSESSPGTVAIVARLVRDYVPLAKRVSDVGGRFLPALRAP